MIGLAAAALGGLAGTLLAGRVARWLGMMAAPNPIVPQHREPVAYLGGVGVACGIGAGLAFAPRPHGSLLAGCALMLLLGVIDDILGLAPLAKLAGQVVAGTVALSLGLEAPFTGVQPLDAALTLLVVLLGVNAVNLTDVCDGLVGGLAAVAALALSVLPGTTALSRLAAAACLGFLFFNLPPARVYLGDAGTHLLGFLLAAEGLNAWSSRPEPRTAVGVVVILGVFLFELLFVVAVRIHKGLPFWRGSPDHFSLRMQAGPFTRWQTVAIAWLASSACAVTGVMLARASAPWAATGTAALVGLAMICARTLLRWEVSSGARPS